LRDRCPTLSPASRLGVIAFIAAQLLGMVGAVALGRWLWPE
jgi:hypothetical protein